MDTKSKNINTSGWAKTVALLLAAALFFGAGFCGSLCARSFFLYNNGQAGSFLATDAFHAVMDDYELRILAGAERASVVTYEDFIKTESGKSTQDQINRINAAFDLLDASGLETFVGDGERFRYALDRNGDGSYDVFFNYHGDIISRAAFESVLRGEELDAYGYNDDEGLDETAYEDEPTAPVTNPAYITANGIRYFYDAAADQYVREDGAAAEMTTVPPAEATTQAMEKDVYQISQALLLLDSQGGDTCYGLISREELIERIKRNYGWQDHAQDDTIRRNDASAHYAVFVATTGNLVTNCGVTRADSEEEILRKLGGAYVETYTDGEYHLLQGERQLAASDFSGELRSEFHAGTASYLERFAQAPDKAISRAYFSYTPTNANDAFTLTKLGYDSFGDGRSSGFYLAWALVLFALACLVCLWLCVTAGKTVDGPRVFFFDRIPLIFRLVLLVGLAVGAGAALFGLIYSTMPTHLLWYYGSFRALKLIFSGVNLWAGLLLALTLLPLLALTCSIVRTAKTHTFTRYTLCHWLLGKPLHWLAGKCKKLIERIKYILAVDYEKNGGKKFKILSLLAVAGFLILSSLLFFLAGLARSALLFFLLWICNGAVFLFAGLLIVSLDRIMAGASQIKQGQLDAKIDTRFMPGFMKQFAADIMSIRDGLNQAVDSAIKDQKMKAELITNVSHDLKTPLTSIVTYVDLLKKCGIEGEDANRYLDILDEKSQRLKTLIEDLVEASKASSGAIELHPVKLNLNEFAAQVVGEHADALEAQGMELILKTPETPVTVTADAQKTSRVMENLFTNISKYGLEGTRVYLDVMASEQFGCMILKNISRYPLDTPAEDLTRRFVRGDSARGGEGSGLGLSIADDLCTLQGGQCIVSTDGDLFKVTVAFPRTQD